MTDSGIPLDKDDLKAALPLSYVCHRLGINISAEGTALCPFHADTNPSFDIYVGDDGIQRWSCHPCKSSGAVGGGDIFDLIQRYEGCGFIEATNRARGFLADLGPDWTPPEVVPKAKGTADDWSGPLNDSRLRAQEAEHHGKLSGWSGLAEPTDPARCRDMDSFLRMVWGWGLTAGGAAVMPFWDPGQTLQGVKYRTPDGRRWSDSGSNFDSFYGIWQGKTSASVLVCAGETDTVWAAYAAKEESVDVDVRGISGEKPPTDLQIAQIRNYRTVYMALDPDEVGVRATREWVAKLAEQGFQDVRICRLPKGRDMRDAKPKIGALLAAALAPLPEPQRIAAAPGGYEVTDGNGNQRTICYWTIEPVARLVGGDDPGLQISVHARKGAHDDVIRWQDLTSTAKLKSWAAERSLTFSGNDRDLTAMVEHIQWRASFVPEILHTDRIGRHDPPAGYGIHKPTIVLADGYIGDMPWLYAPGNQKANMRDDIMLPGDRGPFDWNWLVAFIGLQDPAITHTLLSWACASARRPEVRNFPMLFVGGSSGAGKSTLADLTIRLVGSRAHADLSSITPYVLMQRLASTTSIPIFVDEWTRLSRMDTRLQLQGLIPDIYKGGVSERGQSDLKTVRYRMTAPVLIAGEDTLHLDREMERVVGVAPTRAGQNPAALALISSAPLERFGFLLHSMIASGYPLPPLVASEQPTRPGHNHAVLDGGWATLHALLAYAAENGDVIPDIPLVRTRPSEEDDAIRENVYETAVRECLTFKDTAGLPLVWPDDDGRGTYVRFQPLVPVAEKALDLELPGRARAMSDYFKGRFPLEEHRVRPPGTAATNAVRAVLVVGFHVVPPDEHEPVIIQA